MRPLRILAVGSAAVVAAALLPVWAQRAVEASVADIRPETKRVDIVAHDVTRGAIEAVP